MESQQISVTVKPGLSTQDDHKKKKIKKKKLNKPRSMKLSKSPSLKPSTRRPMKPQLRNIVVDLSSIDNMGNSLSPPYSTSSSRSDISQKSAPLLTRRSSAMSEHGQSSPMSVKSKNSGKSLARKASLRPLRVSLSMKVKRGSSTAASSGHGGVEKATCSSALKDSKLGLVCGGEEDSAMKVCSFSYCSLHGHRHRSAAPPLQRLISIRRRAMRTERSRAARERGKVGSRKAVSPAEEVETEREVLLGLGAEMGGEWGGYGEDNASRSEDGSELDDETAIGCELGDGIAGMKVEGEVKNLVETLLGEGNGSQTVVESSGVGKFGEEVSEDGSELDRETVIGCELRDGIAGTRSGEEVEGEIMAGEENVSLTVMESLGKLEMQGSKDGSELDHEALIGCELRDGVAGMRSGKEVGGETSLAETMVGEENASQTVMESLGKLGVQGSAGDSELDHETAIGCELRDGIAGTRSGEGVEGGTRNLAVTMVGEDNASQTVMEFHSVGKLEVQGSEDGSELDHETAIGCDLGDGIAETRSGKDLGGETRLVETLVGEGNASQTVMESDSVRKLGVQGSEDGSELDHETLVGCELGDGIAWTRSGKEAETMVGEESASQIVMESLGKLEVQGCEDGSELNHKTAIGCELRDGIAGTRSGEEVGRETMVGEENVSQTVIESLGVQGYEDGSELDHEIAMGCELRDGIARTRSGEEVGGETSLAETMVGEDNASLTMESHCAGKHGEQGCGDGSELDAETARGCELGDGFAGTRSGTEVGGETSMAETMVGEENASQTVMESLSVGKLGEQESEDGSELDHETPIGCELGDGISGTRSREGSSSESLSELENGKGGGSREEGEKLEPKSGLAEKIKLKDQKYVRMWRLMYKHTVRGVSGSVENKKTEQEPKSATMESVDESYQIDAVKLVQQAFDEILLPEVQQISPDDEGSVAKSATEKRGFKSWSSVKKILILKRFAKAMEKVKRINRATPRLVLLPLQAEAEAESVRLRRMGSEERRNAEEWMLDFALRQVVSKLEPAQQKRVATLVKAFEAVLPLPELDSSPNSSVEERTRADMGGDITTLMVQSGGERFEEGNCGDQPDRCGEKPSSDESLSTYENRNTQEEKNQPEKTCKEGDKEGNCGDSFVAKALSRGLISDFREDQKLSKGPLHGEKLSYDESLSTYENGNTQEETEEPEHTCKDANEEGNHGNSFVAKMLSRRLVSDFREDQKLSKASLPGDQPEKPSSDESLSTCESVNTQEETNQPEKPVDSSPLGGSATSKEEESVSDSAQDAQSGKQSYMRLWGYVYKHMMSNVDESEAKTPQNAKATQCSQAKPDPADAEKAILRRIEAIKLIEKAIDDVILPENQDSSPEGQTTSSDEEPQAEKIQPQEAEKPSGPKISRNWSNLKKMILLKRFIKALEGAGAGERGFKPRAPRFLEAQGEAEKEKVRLRRQEMDERKRAEEWMVDHALQQAVARLTPARKRKVRLLVEAFETVVTT